MRLVTLSVHTGATTMTVPSGTSCVGTELHPVGARHWIVGSPDEDELETDCGENWSRAVVPTWDRGSGRSSPWASDSVTSIPLRPLWSVVDPTRATPG